MEDFCVQIYRRLGRHVHSRLTSWTPSASASVLIVGALVAGFVPLLADDEDSLSLSLVVSFLLEDDSEEEETDEDDSEYSVLEESSESVLEDENDALVSSSPLSLSLPFEEEDVDWASLSGAIVQVSRG